MEEKRTFQVAEYFKDVELTTPYEPYFCSVEDAISIVIVGTFCGFRNLKQIHQWAAHEKVTEILMTHFGIKNIPCYFWLTQLLKLIKPESMNECFIHWITSLMPESLEGHTVSVDGKTVCSTGKMERYEQALHIVSAQISELGITFAQEPVQGKSNEIPATQRLLKMLRIKGCVVVADALNCQKETAKTIVSQGADYLLSVKENHPSLNKDIADYVQDETLNKTMDTTAVTEKNRERIEERTAYVCTEIEWLKSNHDWVDLCCIGAIHTAVKTKKSVSSEWHYYISSKALTPEELLRHARAEWSVETMHWLLDVHFDEDDCRIQDESVQKLLNMIRKIVLNSIRLYQQRLPKKRACSHIMLDCLIDPLFILSVCDGQN